ncbi:hypothetical protein [Sanguibacter gelidistatuariae]|uniref:hypothetical protein n=1 Tax=Sanguibacter gelidistatuariae TaxID=1814289 RepID=UPI00158821FD|nr:hypothetical protein [Sanguibacter gelidistatuariae]
MVVCAVACAVVGGGGINIARIAIRNYVRVRDVLEHHRRVDASTGTSFSSTNRPARADQILERRLKTILDQSAHRTRRHIDPHARGKLNTLNNRRSIKLGE